MPSGWWTEHESRRYHFDNRPVIKLRGVMNIRIAILKVLSSYPDGRASYASLKSDLAMLSTAEWMARMRRLGERAGPIDIFSARLATRDAEGWTITKAGRDFLDRLERDEVIGRTEEVAAKVSIVSAEKDSSPPRPRRARLRLVRSA